MKNVIKLDQHFTGAGDVYKIKTGVSSRGGGYCFMTLMFEAKDEDVPCGINVVVFENRVGPQWECVGDIAEGSCVYVEGFFHARKQFVEGFKNDAGVPYINRFPQLVVTNIMVLD